MLKNKKIISLVDFGMQPKELPTEIMLLPFGAWKGYVNDDGEPVEFNITRQLGEKAVAYHKQLKEKFPQRDFVIDYEHQSEEGVIAPAAGWFDEIFLKEDGIYAHVKRWTEKAKNFILSGEYRYLSPVFVLNGPDKETGEIIPLRFKSSTITNIPFIDSIKPLTANENSQNNHQQHFIILTDLQTQTKGEITMLEKILGLLGVAKDATFEQASDAIASLKTSAETFQAKWKSAVEALALKDDATGEQVTAAVVALREKKTSGVDSPQVVQLTERVNSLTIALRERDFSDVINRHEQRGAVLPAEVDLLKKDVVDGKITCAELDSRLKLRVDNSMVPLGTVIPAKDKPSANVSEETKSIAASMGVSEDDLKKYGI